jgi:hypothetical protein
VSSGLSFLRIFRLQASPGFVLESIDEWHNLTTNRTDPNWSNAAIFIFSLFSFCWIRPWYTFYSYFHTCRFFSCPFPTTVITTRTS